MLRCKMCQITQRPAIRPLAPSAFRPAANNCARRSRARQASAKWREAALGYDRALHLFDSESLEAARLAWKLLAGRDGVERHYWASEEGRWVKKA